jgi:hypothetical protein
MADRSKRAQILTYCPMPYNGRGPAQSCVSLIGRSGQFGMTERLFVPRATKPIARDVTVIQTLPLPLRYAPWKVAGPFSSSSMETAFRRALDRGSDAKMVAWMWPTTTIELLGHARSRGALSVREMINGYRGTARNILEAAYQELGMAPSHGITAESVEIEREELAGYDRVFASNSFVERSLVEAGVDPSKIIPTAFGWSPERYSFAERTYQPKFKRAVYVGTLNVRKGVPTLLKAWKKSGIDGELVLAGGIHPEMEPLLAPFRDDSSIKLLDFVEDLSALYDSADFLVFPSLEEGGPQVGYEAAGSGLPVITTEAGKGRIIEDGVNGLIVKAGDVDGLANAMVQLAESVDLRERFGRRGAMDSRRFAYDVISQQRAESFANLLDQT